jgi:hypothetical protein
MMQFLSTENSARFSFLCTRLEKKISGIFWEKHLVSRHWIMGTGFFSEKSNGFEITWSAAA